MKIKAVLLCLAAGLSAGALAEEMGGDIYKGETQSRLDALAKIQPGLGVVMHEFGYRATAAYRAANGGNWGLAQYEIKELVEAQEVGEATRPKFAEMLKAFEHANIPPLEKAIENKDLAAFNKQFAATVEACDACHTALGHPYIKYRLPMMGRGGGQGMGGGMQGGLDFNLKTDPVKNVEGSE